MRIINLGHGLFAAAMISLGLLGLIYGNFALVWQPVPDWLPLRETAAYGCAVLMLAGGVSLLWARTAALASRILLAYLLLWLILLKAPSLVMAPLVEVNWLGCGEIAVMVAGGWAYLTGIAYIAAGIAVAFGVYARLAATLTTGMMAIFTLLIWVPAVAAAPKDRLQWTALLISSTLAAGACSVADSYRGTFWRGIRI